MPAERRQMLAVGAAVSLALFGDLTLYAGLVTQRQAVGLSLAQVGILLSAHRVLRIAANPLVGAWMDRAGRRPLFLLGGLLGVVSTALYGVGYGFWPFLAARLLWGLAWALLNVGGLTIALDISTPATRGRLSGIYNTWVWAGYGLGPLAGGLLIDQIGFRSAMLLCAGISALGVLAALVLLRETRPTAQLGTDFTSTKRAPRAALPALRAQPELVRVVLLNGLTTFAGDGIMLATIAVLVEQRLDPALGVGVATASGAVIALRSLLAAVTSPVAGRISDGPAGRAGLMRFSLVCGALAFGVLALLVTPAGAAVGVLVGAISGGAGIAALAAWMGDLTHGRGQAAALGAYAAAGDIGSASGPYLAFALLPLAGLAGVYALTAGLLAIGLALASRGLAKVGQNHHTIDTEF